MSRRRTRRGKGQQGSAAPAAADICRSFGARAGRTLRAFWKQALALGVVAAVVSYFVPRLLSGGEHAVRGIAGSDAPLVVTVKHPGEYESESFYTPMYLFSKVSPSIVPAKFFDDNAGYYDWARRNGGVPGQEQPLRVTLSGRDERPVIIDGLRARVVARSTPRSGWFTHERGCGAVEVRQVEVDLDEHPPSLHFTDAAPGAQSAAKPRKLPLTLEVSSTDVEVVDVLAVTHRSDAKWKLDILYTAAGKTGVVSVPGGNKSFEVTALTPGRARFYRRSWPEDGGRPSFRRQADGDPSSAGVTFC